MIKRLFHSVSEKDKQNAVDEIVLTSSPRPELYVMIILGMILGTIGLYLDNAAVIIGSMLISPIMTPLMGIALGLSISDEKLIYRSFGTAIKTIVISIATAVVVSFLFYNGTAADSTQIVISSHASLPYLLIALASGCAVAFAMVKPTLSAALPGVAVAVALVPPLAALGIGISKGSSGLITGSLEQFLINAFGVIVSSLVIFQMMNFYLEKMKVEKDIKTDEHAIAHQKAAEEK